MANEKYKTPYADLLPPLSSIELAALRNDIKAAGCVRDAIHVTEDEVILDGNNRYRIDKDSPVYVVPGSGKWSEAERKAYAIKANINRRHLSTSQVAELERKVLKPLAMELRWGDVKAAKKTAEGGGKPTPVRSEAEVGNMLGRPRITIHSWTSITPVMDDKCNNPKPVQVTTKIAAGEIPKLMAMIDKGLTQDRVAADLKVSQPLINRIVNKQRKAEEEAKKREEKIRKLGSNIFGIHHGDFREIGSIIEDGTVDLIFTDPPYDEASVPLYADLAEFGNRVLKPGGWCLAYAGHTFLPNVLSGMTKHLTYGWCFAIHHTGGDLRFRKFQVQNKWKPVVGFYKPKLDVWWEWFPDMVSGGKEKDSHEWQQAEAEAAHFISALSPPKAVVCDPFCGGGTTPTAAKRLGRQWVAFEIKKDAAEKARLRVSENTIGSDDQAAK